MLTIEDIKLNIRDHELYEDYIEVYMRDETIVEIDRKEFEGLQYITDEDIAKVILISEKIEEKEDTMTTEELYDYITDTRQQLDEYTAVYIEILSKNEDGELTGVEYDLNEIELIDGLLYLNGVIEIQDYEIAKVEHVNIAPLKPVRPSGVRFILTENE